MPNLEPFDPHALIAKTRKGALSVGETHALSVHVAGLERALRHRTEAQIATNKSEFIKLMLDEAGLNFVVILPGESEHYVPVPASDPHLAVHFLLKTLRARRGAASPIGTEGAPTKADLRELTRALRSAKPTVQGNIPNSLEDLGL
jgi:hypothetical protein